MGVNIQVLHVHVHVPLCHWVPQSRGNCVVTAYRCHLQDREEQG